jgi:hypothetical protein
MAKNLIDWHSASLSASTKIDAGYKNTQNVRRFFKKEIGEDFKFSREFMKYLLDNKGITLKQAAEYWKTLNR